MEELQPLPVAAVAMDCQCCFGKVNEADHFCQACGFPLKGSDAEQQIFMYRRGFKKIELDTLEKKIKSAATTLYVLSGLFLLYAVSFFFMNSANDNIAADIVSNIAVSVIFLLLASWSRKRPVASIVSAMVLYVLLQLRAAIMNPHNIINGLFIKIVIIGYLVKGLTSALEAEKIRKQHNI